MITEKLTPGNFDIPVAHGKNINEIKGDDADVIGISKLWPPRGWRNCAAFFGRAKASRPVVALTEATAAIQSPTGALTIFRRHNKPALGPVGDTLDDLQPPFGGSVVRRQL